jgi:hypothetical protein
VKNTPRGVRPTNVYPRPLNASSLVCTFPDKSCHV